MVIDYSKTINRFTALDAYPLPRIDQQVNELAKCKWFSTLDLKSSHQVPLATEDRAYTAFEADGKLYRYCRLPFGVTNGVPCFQRIIDSVIAEQYRSELVRDKASAATFSFPDLCLTSYANIPSSARQA